MKDWKSKWFSFHSLKIFGNCRQLISLLCGSDTSAVKHRVNDIRHGALKSLLFHVCIKMLHIWKK